MRANQRTRWLTIAAIVAALAAVGLWGYTTFLAPHTENAYTGAEVAQITPMVAAPVREVSVHETQSVAPGDVLVRLDDTDARLAVSSAQAGLANARAELVRARSEAQRRRTLGTSGAISVEEASNAQASFNVAVAQVQIAESALAQARVNLERTVIRAPLAGVIAQRSVDVGQRVQPAQVLMTVVPVDHIYVDANFKEGQLARVRPGQHARLTSDLYGERVVYQGRVVGFAGGTGSAFSAIPAQNATGNWIKVVQRLPVRIALDASELRAHPLRVGLSMHAVVSLDARGAQNAE